MHVMSSVTQWRSQEKRLGMAKILGSDIDNSRCVKRGFLAKPTILSYRVFKKKTQSIGGGFSHPGHPPGCSNATAVTTTLV